MHILGLNPLQNLHSGGLEAGFVCLATCLATVYSVLLLEGTDIRPKAAAGHRFLLLGDTDPLQISALTSDRHYAESFRSFPGQSRSVAASENI
jgi:hypothetical protein